MKVFALAALGAVALGTALTASAPATAAVRVVVGVPAPAQECVLYKRHHHVRYAYCSEPMYSGPAIVIGGVTYRENLHFKMINGHRHFWIKGRWVRHD